MHPILFTVPTPWGDLPVYAFGAMLGLTLAVGWGVVSKAGQRAGHDRDMLANAYLIGALGALCGARLLYVLTNLEAFSGVAEWFAVQQGGMAAYGALLGGFGSCAVYLRLKKVSVLGFADLCAPVLALAVLLTRVGCYLDGSDFGAPLGAGAPAWLAALGTFPHWPEATGLHGSPAFLSKHCWGRACWRSRSGGRCAGASRDRHSCSSCSPTAWDDSSSTRCATIRSAACCWASPALSGWRS
jgi:phosphatidylglycerol:prolipoprotein diacylglycerol transferase